MQPQLQVLVLAGTDGGIFYGVHRHFVFVFFLLSDRCVWSDFMSQPVDGLCKLRDSNVDDSS